MGIYYHFKVLMASIRKRKHSETIFAPHFRLFLMVNIGGLTCEQILCEQQIVIAGRRAYLQLERCGNGKIKSLLTLFRGGNLTLICPYRRGLRMVKAELGHVDPSNLITTPFIGVNEGLNYFIAYGETEAVIYAEVQINTLDKLYGCYQTAVVSGHL